MRSLATFAELAKRSPRAEERELKGASGPSSLEFLPGDEAQACAARPRLAPPKKKATLARYVVDQRQASQLSQRVVQPTHLRPTDGHHLQCRLMQMWQRCSNCFPHHDRREVSKVASLEVAAMHWFVRTPQITTVSAFSERSTSFRFVP